MILYNKDRVTNTRHRPNKTLNMQIEELPERPNYNITSTRDRVKFVKMIDSMIRRSMEYKEYIRFLKSYMNMSKCLVLKGLSTENGKRYTIEIHHEPFSLFSIADTVIRKREALGEPLNPFYIADEVMGLHYDEKVGLIPLSKTMHELTENDKVFIPLQLVYQNYNVFYDEYEEFMDPKYRDLIETKVNLSLKCGDILSDILDAEFVYVNIDGFDLPSIPSEWGDVFKLAKTEESVVAD